MQKLRRNLIFAGLAAGCLVGGCTSRQAAKVIDEIQTLPAVTGNVQNSVTFVGNVTGGQTASLTWETSGVIGMVDVALGDQVREGQILMSLDPDFLSADVIRAEIPYITAIEELEEVLDSETAKAQAYKDLKDKEAALVKAEKYQESLKYPHAVIGDIKYWSEQVDIYRETYEEALRSLNDAAIWRNSPNLSEHNLYEERRKTMLNALNKYAEVYNNYLYYSGTATDNEIAQAAADIDVAQADYEKALKVFQTYSDYPREKDINTAQMKVENALDTYNRRNIVASINGVVTQVSTRTGDYVTRGTAALRLDNTDHLYVPMDISEIDILSIHDGMKALVVLDSNTDKTYDGIVTTVSASGESASNRVTFQTMVEILEPDDQVKIGMTAEVNLITEEAENVLIVPANAVFSDGKNSYVGVSDGITCNDVPVTVGITSDTVAEIRGGFLKEGDPVCVPSIDNRILKAMGMVSTDQTELLIRPADGSAASEREPAVSFQMTSP